jgi:hypothetical protein
MIETHFCKNNKQTSVKQRKFNNLKETRFHVKVD